MNAALRELGSMVMLGIRGTKPGDPALEEDLAACAHAGVRMVILFDRDVFTGGERNVESPTQLRRLSAYVRERLGEDATIAIDQEGGRVQRLSSVNGFRAWPSAHDFASMPDSEQLSQARDMAETLRDVGGTLNFAPGVDVNVNPMSPVIGALDRSFSSDPEAVVRCAQHVLRAHADAGIGCVLKHFPGHGSATADSHHDLVDITETWNRDLELSPYRALMNHRVGVMTGHLMLTTLDQNRPASLSRAITTGLLRESLGFQGPVFTDALDMEGVRARWSLEESLLLGVHAGADVLVHACNSARREYAADVVRAMEGVAPEVPAIAERSALSRERMKTLRHT